MKLLAIWCLVFAFELYPQPYIWGNNKITDMSKSDLAYKVEANTMTSSDREKPDLYSPLASYKKALQGVKASSTYLKLSQNKTLPSIVSCKQISWGIYTFFFEDQIRSVIGNRKPEFERVQDEHLETMPFASRLNSSSTGKILISFSGIYDRIFFAEMTLLPSVGTCSSTRPVLNEVYVYVFHIKENDDVALLKVKRLD